MTTSVPEWVCTEEAIKNDEAFYLHPVSWFCIGTNWAVNETHQMSEVHYLIACLFV